MAFRSVWEPQQRAMQMAIPILMEKQRMQREDAMIQEQIKQAEAARQAKVQEKEMELAEKAFQAKLKYIQGMMQDAYKGGDVEGVQAFGQPLAQMGFPTPSREAQGPSLPGQGPPREFFAMDQKQGMSEAELTQRALSGDQMAQAILERMAERKRGTAAAGAGSVNLNLPMAGAIPPGYERQYDDEGRPVRDVPIPGSKPATEAEAAKKEDEIKGRIRGKVGATAVDEINHLFGLLDTGKVRGPRERMLANSDGPGAFVYAGTPTGDFAATLQSIKDTIAIDRLLEIKASGAGLGHIPQKQLEALARSLGALQEGLSDDLLKKNLQRVAKQYQDVVRLAMKEVEDPTFRGLIDNISPDIVESWSEEGGAKIPTPAPQAAIEHLRQNPDLKEYFKKKYGYLPEGF